MDEGTLNDLLECSVCLERLDTSSKVLPCQHTFCRKCLEEIYHKHKELRCPECRILVNIKIDDLPPNVLLMRLLEGMKNSGGVGGQKKILKSNKTAPLHQHQGVLQHPVQIQQQPVERSNNKHNIGHVVPHQPYAKALYDYVSKEAGDLCFKRGDIIILKKRIDSHWYHGESGGKQGVFPLSYVQIITPVPSHIPQCKALYDFRMSNDEEEGCLVFNKGDIINVIRRVDENWAEGKLDGRIGIFPLAFVELNSLARSLMKLSTNAQPGPSKVAPPTPTTEDSTPLIPTDHSTSVTSAAPQHKGPISASDSSSNVTSSSSSTPNVSSSNTSSSSSTAPSSPASPPARTDKQVISPRNGGRKSDVSKNLITNVSVSQQAVQSPQVNRTVEGRSHHHHSKEKRHSLTNMPVPHHNSVHRHSAEILQSSTVAQVMTSTTSSHSSDRSKRSSGVSSTSTLAEIQLPAAFMALYPYKPQKPDELELKKGGIYMVSEICQDGWYKGTSNRTQKCGVFPGNYVTPARGIPTQTSASTTDSRLPVSFHRGNKGTRARPADPAPPELPPRASSPQASGSVSWHAGMERNNSSSASNTLVQAKCDKNKDKKEKGTVSLMRRLTSMKRSKSPPPSSYSMDNPVFEDTTSPASSLPTPSHPVHVRSTENQGGSTGSSPDVHRHRKSNSLDASHKSSKTGTQTVRERFRCITPYPPNSEYELELQLNDIIYVHKKREDGWYKGTQQRTGKTGLFPASFVESF